MALKESLIRRVLGVGVGLVVFALCAATSVTLASSRAEAQSAAAWGEPVTCKAVRQGESYQVEVQCLEFTTKVQMLPADSEKTRVNVWLRGDAIFIAGDQSHGGSSKPPLEEGWWEALFVTIPLSALFGLLVGALFVAWVRRQRPAQI